MSYESPSCPFLNIRQGGVEVRPSEDDGLMLRIEKGPLSRPLIVDWDGGYFTLVMLTTLRLVLSNL
jgi:hypothetical protein